MAIALTCLCGTEFQVGDDEAGLQVVCPACGELLRAAAQSQEDEEIIIVVPVEDEAPEDIPEVEVEEFRVAAWDKAKKKSSNVEYFDDDVLPPKRADDSPATFAEKLAAAGSDSWASIGTIRLKETTACLAFTGPGVLAMVAQGEKVLILDMQKGKVFAKLRVHPTDVTSVALSFDGETALTGDRAGNILYWNLLTQRPTREFDGHCKSVSVLAYSPNSLLAAAGDCKGQTILWKPEARKERLLEKSDWNEKITALAFSTDNTKLMAGSESGRIQVWCVKTGRVLARFRTEKAIVQSLRFSGNGAFAFAALLPGTAWTPRYPMIVRYDLTTGEATSCFTPASESTLLPHGVLLDHRCKRVLIVGNQWIGPASPATNTHLEIWDLASAKRIHTFTDLHTEAACMAVATSDNGIAVATQDASLQMFTMPSWDALTARKTSPDLRRRRHDASDL